MESSTMLCGSEIASLQLNKRCGAYNSERLFLPDLECLVLSSLCLYISSSSDEPNLLNNVSLKFLHELRR